jgi:hypothetical protein
MMRKGSSIWNKKESCWFLEKGFFVRVLFLVVWLQIFDQRDPKNNYFLRESKKTKVILFMFTSIHCLVEFSRGSKIFKSGKTYQSFDSDRQFFFINCRKEKSQETYLIRKI